MYVCACVCERESVCVCACVCICLCPCVCVHTVCVYIYGRVCMRVSVGLCLCVCVHEFPMYLLRDSRSTLCVLADCWCRNFFFAVLAPGLETSLPLLNSASPKKSLLAQGLEQDSVWAVNDPYSVCNQSPSPFILLCSPRFPRLCVVTPDAFPDGIVSVLLVQDPSFTSVFDQRCGFRSRSILCASILLPHRLPCVIEALRVKSFSEVCATLVLYFLAGCVPAPIFSLLSPPVSLLLSAPPFIQE